MRACYSGGRCSSVVRFSQPAGRRGELNSVSVGGLLAGWPGPRLYADVCECEFVNVCVFEWMDEWVFVW